MTKEELNRIEEAWWSSKEGIIDMAEVFALAEKALDQPTIIRCRDCKWWTKQKDSLQGRCALLHLYPTGAWYCGDAQKESEDVGN